MIASLETSVGEETRHSEYVCNAFLPQFPHTPASLIQLPFAGHILSGLYLLQIRR